ncbi:MAG: ABC transporter ATP-binding protein [Kofleriaceae bacterium]|nr:ABC transporter ATP-binding protein [Myxococcales bacterium]MCB9563080.1 ABC transporter ATP-binding protein [Kofleriaceae bacterium]
MTAPPGEAVIDVADLAKTYRTPFTRRRVEALRGVTFQVRRGEIFGFLGPNGAGKTTTIRILMGLISATAGTAKILGNPVPSRQARARLGFLPEQPYFYDYLTVGELLDLAGRLFGLDAATRKRRADELIAKVGLDRARTQALKKFSKGMMQRAGLAQALINDPDLVVFDEPMSGLDPIGRKEVRDLILELRDAGKTVFFSSHILSDVESVSDRVAIVIRGQIQAVGSPRELAGQTLLGVDVTLRLDDPHGAAADEIAARGDRVRRGDRELSLTVAADVDVDELLAFARERGARVVVVAPRHDTLEDLFVKSALASDGGTAAGAAVTEGP